MRRRHPPDRAFGAEEMLLPDNLGQGLGAQPVRQGPRRLGLKACSLEKIAHPIDIGRRTPSVTGSYVYSPKLTEMRRPPRSITRRQPRAVRSASARAAVERIASPFTSRTMSPA